MSQTRSNCGKCRSTSKKDGLVGCEGSCRKWFHYSCVNFSEAEFKLLEKNKNLFFLCDVCKIECEIVNKDVLHRIDENLSTLTGGLSSYSELEAKIDAKLNDFSAKITHHISELKSEVAENESSLSNLVTSLRDKLSGKNNETQVPTYSQKLIGKPSSRVLIMPRCQEQTSQSTGAELFKSLDPVDSNLKFTAVKHVRRGGLLLDCSDGAAPADLETAVKEAVGDKFSVRKLKSFAPLVRIVGIPDHLGRTVYWSICGNRMAHYSVATRLSP